MIEFLKSLRRFINNLSKYSINTYAASSAFFMFLSLVPIIFMIIYALPYTGIDKEVAIRTIMSVLPTSIQSLVSEIILDVYSVSAVSLSFPIVTIIWSAAKAFADITRGLDRINGIKDKNYWIVRFWACFYTVILIAVIILLLIIMVFGKNINNLILSAWPEIQPVYALLLNLRFVIVLLILSLIFAFLYKFVPSEKMKFTEQIPGAVFTAVLWGVFSWGFSVYISYFNDFGLYGRLSTIIIAMFWMYFCMYIFFAGAYLNRFLKEDELL